MGASKEGGSCSEEERLAGRCTHEGGEPQPRGPGVQFGGRRRRRKKSRRKKSRSKRRKKSRSKRKRKKSRRRR